MVQRQDFRITFEMGTPIRHLGTCWTALWVEPGEPYTSTKLIEKNQLSSIIFYLSWNEKRKFLAIVFLWWEWCSIIVLGLSLSLVYFLTLFKMSLTKAIILTIIASLGWIFFTSAINSLMVELAGLSLYRSRGGRDRMAVTITTNKI
jgi:hypothetical protein